MDTSIQKVGPHDVCASTSFDYDRLVNDFGLKKIDDELLLKLKIATNNEPHHYLTRSIFYAHQDFDKIIQDKLDGKQFYIYTGRGPSSDSLHIGHLIPMQFSVWLQRVLKCVVVIEISDEEKMYFKNETLDGCLEYASENIRDIIACGFDPELTFVFSSLKYSVYMRPLVSLISKKITVNESFKIYGFDTANNIGCIIPCAIDQVPYFRHIRHYAKKLGYEKPSIICSKFLVGLEGIHQKASSTSNIKPIFLSDVPQDVARKINKHAFSGGQSTLAQQKLLGVNLSVDVSYIYLTYFMEDEIELEKMIMAWVL